MIFKRRPLLPVADAALQPSPEMAPSILIYASGVCHVAFSPDRALPSIRVVTDMAPNSHLLFLRGMSPRKLGDLLAQARRICAVVP